MGKQTGLGMFVYLDGYDISNDVGSLSSITTPRQVIDVTGVDKSAYERLPGHGDGAVTFEPFMNPSANRSHPVLSTLPLTDRQLAGFFGATIGNPCFCTMGKQIGYDGKRDDKGALNFKVEQQSNGFLLEWGEMLTPGIASQGSAGALASLDYGATIGSTSFGLQSHLHVFGVTGTSVTVHIQHSNDDGNTDPYADISGGVYAAATGIGAQRIQTASNTTIKRYLRINTTGTFSAATFAVIVIKNTAAVSF